MLNFYFGVGPFLLMDAELPELPPTGVGMSQLMHDAIISLGGVVASALAGYFAFRVIRRAIYRSCWIDIDVIDKRRKENVVSMIRGFNGSDDEASAHRRFDQLVQSGEYSTNEWDDFKRGWQDS